MSGYVTNELSYPNLTNCRVTLIGGSASSKPPVHLSSDCLSAVQMTLKEEPHEFVLERSILQRKDEWDQELSASSREELQQNVIVRMKSVTGAKEEICISMLESNGYDLNASIETYFQSPR